MTKDEKEFRTWLKDNYGIQDYNNYSGTQAEELAIQYAHFKQTGTNTLVGRSLPINEEHYKDLRTNVVKMESLMRQGNYDGVMRLFGPLLQKLENLRQ